MVGEITRADRQGRPTHERGKITMTVKSTSTKSAGTVSITIEAYNELILRLAKFESSFQVRKGWNNEEIEAEIDIKAIAGLITEKFKASGYAETFKLRPSGDWSQIAVRIADVIKTEEQIEADRIAEEERNERYRLEREERKRTEEAAK